MTPVTKPRKARAKLSTSAGILLIGLFLFTYSTAAQAQAILYIGTDMLPSGATAPGSATDYTFFGNAGQPTDLTDFSVTTLGSIYPGNGSYSSIIAPGGTTEFTTGIVYDNGGNLGTFTSLNGGNFDVNLLYGDTDTNNVNDLSISINSVSTPPITDVGTSNYFAEFQVVGATPGEVFNFGAVSSVYPYVGGITFQAVAAVPEPNTSTSAMIIFAVALLAFSFKRFRKPAPLPA